MYIVSVFISWQERKEMHRIFTSAYFLFHQVNDYLIMWHSTLHSCMLKSESIYTLENQYRLIQSHFYVCIECPVIDTHALSKSKTSPSQSLFKRRRKGRARGQINQLCTVWYCTWRCDIPDLILNRIDLILNRIDYTELFHFSISIVLSYI